MNWQDAVGGRTDPQNPAGPAAPARKILPSLAAALLALPLLGLGPLGPAAPPPAMPDTSWHGLQPGMPVSAAGEALAREGFRLTLDVMPGLAAVTPIGRACQPGWSEDRICERAVLHLVADADGVLRLGRITAEATLPGPMPLSSLLAVAEARLGAAAEDVAEETALHPRDIPLRRYAWVVPRGEFGAARVELGLPLLEEGRVSRWRLVLEPAPAGTATSVALLGG